MRQRHDVVKLISAVTEQDATGQYITTESAMEVQASVKSVSRYEWAQAAIAGVTAAACLLVADANYSGEQIAEWRGARYAIYRVYERDDNFTELYLRAEAGVTYGT